MTDGPIGILALAFTSLIGLPLLGAGLWWLRHRWNLRHSGLLAMVQVVGYESRKDSDSAIDWHHPVVMLGHQRHALSQGETRQRWPVGTWLPVRYHPGEEARMVIDKPGEMYFLPGMIAAMGAGILLFGLLAI